jgi:acyl phosphate:glycerol-3-phosphate acyltransferase
MFEGLDPALVAAAIVGGYLLGSIPFGILATRLGGAGDLRTVGSGNIGATNVLRTGRRDLALITLIGDGGKGALAVLIAWLATRDAPPEHQVIVMSLAGGAAFLGHLFPVWLKFKGGKGVATFFGTLLAAALPVGILAGLAWLVVAFAARISSLAALVAAGLAPLFAIMTGRPGEITLLSLFMAVLIFIRHAPNIRRLLKGEEPRIGADETPAS